MELTPIGRRAYEGLLPFLYMVMTNFNKKPRVVQHYVRLSLAQFLPRVQSSDRCSSWRS